MTSSSSCAAGGSKADLAAFDSEVVARAIAGASKPIWTGIGHTGDESVADIVANRACITPTECGQYLVVQIGAWWRSHVGEPAVTLSRRAPSLLAEELKKDTQARGRLTRAARSQLRVHRERLGRRGAVIGRSAPESLTAQAGRVRAHAARLVPLSTGHLAKGDERVRSWRRLMTAYDVDRQLERGYTLTLDDAGRLVRNAESIGVGQRITTRFADGTLQSRVESEQKNEET